MPKYLLANGDSFTAGDGLSDFSHKLKKKSILTWPGVLCRQANIPLFCNIAESCGGSAQQIARTTIYTLHDLLYKHNIQPDDILVGLMYGAYVRFEIPLIGKGWVKGYMGNKEKMIQTWLRYCFSYETSAFFYFQHIYLLQSYLEKLNISYFMMNTINNIFDLNGQEYELYKQLINFDKFFFISDNDNKYGFVQWAEMKKYRQTPCTHYYEDAHNDFVIQYSIPWLKIHRYL